MSVVAPFIWVLPVAAGIGLAAWLTRAGGRLGWARALAAGPPAAAVLLAVWGLARGFDWLASGGGPMKWVGVSRDIATIRGPLDSAVLRLGVGGGLLLAAALVVIARLRKHPPRPMPLALVGAVIAAACALLIGGVFTSDPIAFAAAMPVDLVAFMPPAAAGIAIAFIPIRAVRAPTETKAPRAPTPLPPSGAEPGWGPPPPDLDGETALRAAQLLTDAPTFKVDPTGAAETAAPGPLDRVWQAHGGNRRAPASIGDILGRLGSDRPGAMLTDLPAPTEDALVATLVTAAMLERAARVLVIGAGAARLRDQVAAGLRGLGAGRPGPLVAGDGELRDTLAHDTLPALICADVDDLAGTLLAARTQRGASWLRFIQLVVLVEVDRRQPIAATHMGFALRRLALAFEQQRTRPAWCAVGGSSPGSLRFVEESTMTRFERVALGAHATAAVKVWVRTARGDGEGTAAAEIAARAQLLAGTGLTLHRDVAGAGAGAGYHGDASLALLDDRQLASQFLGRGNLAHRLGTSRGHLGLWWVNDTPLARFLLRDGALVGLEQRGELQTPRPVAGLDNPYLATAHLEASLHDGSADERALRRAFGDRAVDQLLSSSAPAIAGDRARFNPSGRAIERSRIIAPAGSRTTDPRRDTVSASTIEVKSSRSGEVLLRVDRRTAPTRFYPHRVFRAGGALYQVGGDAVAPGADSFVVKPAPSGTTPTIPQLSLEVVNATWVEAPKQVQIGKLSFARGTAEILLRESVTGAISRDKGAPAVKYAAITAEYPTRAAVVLFADKPSTRALAYAGAMTARLIPAQLLVEPEDVDVVPLPRGIANLARPALVFADRHLGGLGVADALDAATIHNLLRWTWGILYRCACMNGCDQCTPPDILAAEPDKVGALKLLGG